MNGSVEHIAGDLVPLAVDVDGTLIRTDLLHEAILQHIAGHPLDLPRMFTWLPGGKSDFKSRLADHTAPDLTSIPLREETVALIRAAQGEGRPIYLASASDYRYIVTIAERIGGIAGIFATTRERNLAGANKAAALNEAFGRLGYDYVGDMPVDMPVWAGARRQYVVSHGAAFEQRVLRHFQIGR